MLCLLSLSLTMRGSRERLFTGDKDCHKRKRSKLNNPVARHSMEALPYQPEFSARNDRTIERKLAWLSVNAAALGKLFAASVLNRLV